MGEGSTGIDLLIISVLYYQANVVLLRKIDTSANVISTLDFDGVLYVVAHPIRRGSRGEGIVAGILKERSDK